MISALLLSAAALTNFYNVKVLKVQDGDTLQVELMRVPAVFKKIGVRIIGIDTREITSNCPAWKAEGMLAKAAMKNLVEGNTVDLLNCTRDKYFRILCEGVVNQKIDISSYMIDRGLAVEYWGGTKEVEKCPR